MADEVPFNQQAFVQDIIQRILLCRDPDGGYARDVPPILVPGVMRVQV
ncbi:MAG: hypothetical protein ABSF61_12975 [Anaerolineales bacterium]|jgi:hypothetical protein